MFKMVILMAFLLAATNSLEYKMKLTSSEAEYRVPFNRSGAEDSSELVDDSTKCSEEESEVLAGAFIKLDRDSSNCPDEAWLESMSEFKLRSQSLFINIGFNKGYNFAVWMNIFAPWTKVTPYAWFLSLDGLNLPGPYTDRNWECGEQSAVDQIYFTTLWVC